MPLELLDKHADDIPLTIGAAVEKIVNARELADDFNRDSNKVNSLKSERFNSNGLNSNQFRAYYSKEAEQEGVKFAGLSESDSICSDERSPDIPDGGWGWVVVISAFLVSACADGLAFSFGLLREEFTAYFNTTQSQTSLIGSFFIATPLLAGPIMSALVDRYGCRIMTMIAGLLSTVGFLLASISNSVGMLCLTFGFITGLAMGIMYVTAVVSVAFWFDKRRNLAVSLASCGMGFGTLIYSPLTSYLLTVYDWRNTIVLLAGTLLNMCVCGALMRNPEWLTMKQKEKRKLYGKTSSNGSLSSKSLGGDSVWLSAEELHCLLKSGKSPEYILATIASSIAEAERLDATTKLNSMQSQKKMSSTLNLPTFIKDNETVPTEVIEKLMANKSLYNIILLNYPSILNARSKSEIKLNVEALSGPVEHEPVKTHIKLKMKRSKKDSESKNDRLQPVEEESFIEQKSASKHNINKSDSKHSNSNKTWITRQISTDYHYLSDVPLYRNTIMHRGAMMNIPRYKLRAASLPDIYRNSMWSLGSESENDNACWCDGLRALFQKTFDFRMFTEFHFLMFNLASLILSVWFIVPYFFLMSYMSANNTEGGPTMISVIGIASSIGIVALGWAGDQPWINVTKTYAVCLIVCGISIGLYPFFITNYWALVVISAMFGLSFASSYSYTPTILMELMPLERFTVAYGLILLSQGIGHLVGPPIGGLLFDLTQSWDLTFYMGGAWLLISASCVGIIAYTKDARMCGNARLLKEEFDDQKSEHTS